MNEMRIISEVLDQHWKCLRRKTKKLSKRRLNEELSIRSTQALSASPTALTVKTEGFLCEKILLSTKVYLPNKLTMRLLPTQLSKTSIIETCRFASQ